MQANLTPPVWSVFGRTGAVAADSEDYSAFYQPLDPDLTAIAAHSTTAYGRGFLPLADASAALSYIGAAAAAHAHIADQSVISLTPINSFTAFASPTYRNALTVIPAIKLAIIEFSVARATLPASDTTLMSWSATYTPTPGIKVVIPAISLSGSTSTPAHFAYVDGTNLKWYLGSAGGGTNVDYLVGTLAFTYQ